MPPLLAWVDVPASLGLLTRLPIRVDIAAATARGPRSVWAYPVAGLVVVLIALAVGIVGMRIGLSAAFASALMLLTQIVLTGALHEDGLADCCDGFWGGYDRDRRLLIMKDSHIGTYGTIALVLSLMVRWAALTLILPIGPLWGALVGIAMLSRAAMACVMAALPHARDTGLSHMVGRPSLPTLVLGVALATLATSAMVGIGLALVLISITGLATFIWAVIAKAKVGGQTGDVLGAAQQLTEIACLLAVVALL